MNNYLSTYPAVQLRKPRTPTKLVIFGTLIVWTLTTHKIKPQMVAVKFAVYSSHIQLFLHLYNNSPELIILN